MPGSWFYWGLLLLISTPEGAKAQITAKDSAAMVITKKSRSLDNYCCADPAGMFFEAGSAQLSLQVKLTLDAYCRKLNEYPKMQVQVTGYTDCRGSTAYNDSLSLARAKNAAAYMKMNGIDPRRLVPVGYGSTHLFNDCACQPDGSGPGKNCTEAEHAYNRQVTVRLLRMDFDLTAPGVQADTPDKVKKPEPLRSIQKDKLVYDHLISVSFNKGSAEITEDQKYAIDSFYNMLQNKYPHIIVEVSGYTDCRGSKYYNDSLSLKRAQNVANMLIDMGIDPRRLVPYGHGSASPVNSCDCHKNECSENEYKANRYVILRLTDFNNKW